MTRLTPRLRVPLRGDLLTTISERFPGMDSNAVDLLNTIRAVSQGISDCLDSKLACYQLTSAKFYVLAYLYFEDMLARPNPRPSEIAESLGITRATVTGLLDGLERAGMIERRSAAEDRRMLVVTITESAKAFFNSALPPVMGTMQPIITDTLTEDERETLLVLLTKIEVRLSACKAASVASADTLPQG